MNDQDLVLEDDLIAVLLRSTDPSVSLDDFNEIERFKLMSAQRSFFRRAEAQFFRYRNGLLDEDAWQTVRHRVRVNLESPVDRQIWDRDKSSVYTAAFVREIESFAPPR